jgi:flagellar P-ring protein precursor FlgI
MLRRVTILALLAVAQLTFSQDATSRKVRIRDIATVEGVRENPLIGYGLVVGLNGTGDRRQTLFTTQLLANVMQKMGLQIPASAVRVNNIAAVFVTANLPPFARSGTQLDVTVSSIGDAKSLEGGLLLLTPLRAGDSQVYAEAQGPLTLGGYTAGVSGNSKQVNHPTVGRIPGGGTVERDFAVDMQSMKNVALLLREPDFSTVKDMADAINREVGKPAAQVRDARRIEIDVRESGSASATALLARIEDVMVETQVPARVVVNERTGTIVLGKNVRLSAVSILHGTLAIEISTQYEVSQPQSFSQGTTTPVAQPDVRARESAARKVELSEGATVEELVTGLQSMGATARDVIAILQAIKAAGALQAELEVL